MSIREVMKDLGVRPELFGHRRDVNRGIIEVFGVNANEWPVLIAECNTKEKAALLACLLNTAPKLLDLCRKLFDLSETNEGFNTFTGKQVREEASHLLVELED